METVLNNNLEIFKYLTENEIKSLAGVFKLRTYQSGEIVFREGDAGESLFIVLNGKIKILGQKELYNDEEAKNESQEILLNEILKGRTFGEMALLDKKPRCASAIAAVTSEVLELTRADFINLSDSNPVISNKIYRALGELLSLKARKITEAFKSDLTKYLKEFLLWI
ncbi:MAG: cyclic nucleotide-binding domain-containing protein [Candidatus Coatesbacteria bacterium]|nr:cyclic nucleotide-binding domain-containing protein [Candidatus Coatesbacteria bacterium]